MPDGAKNRLISMRNNSEDSAKRYRTPSIDKLLPKQQTVYKEVSKCVEAQKDVMQVKPGNLTDYSLAASNLMVETASASVLYLLITPIKTLLISLTGSCQ